MPKKTTPRSRSVHDAYRDLLESTVPLDALKLKKQTVLNRRVEVRQGSYPSIDRMHEWLRAAGWKRVVEEAWVPGPAPRRTRVVGPVSRGPRKARVLRGKPARSQR